MMDRPAGKQLAVWIEELFIDQFGEADDLALRPLADDMNVIRVRSAQEAARLLDFVPGLLYGPRSDWLPGASGSAIIRIHDESGLGHNQQLLDLCRLTLDEQGTLSELQVLSVEGEQTVDACQLPFGRLDLETYLALYTNRLAPLDRVVIWHASERLRPLWRRKSRREARVTDGRPFAAPQPDTTGQREPRVTQVEKRAADKAARWRQVQQQWQSVRPVWNEPLTLVDSAKAANRKVAEDAAGAAIAAEQRAQYFAARHQVQLCRDQVRELRTGMAPIEARIVALEIARQWQPRWQELQELEQSARVESPGSATAADLTELTRLDAELARLRDELQQHREHAERQSIEVRERTQRRAEHERRRGARRRELESLLDSYPDCREHWLAVCRERTALRERTRQAEPTAPECWPHVLTRSDAETAIARVAAADRELQRCRSLTLRWPRQLLRTLPIGDMARENPTTASLTAAGVTDCPDNTTVDRVTVEGMEPRSIDGGVARDEPTPVPTGDAPEMTREARIASLLRQVRQLREESRRLLERQLLSRHSLISIGLLFSGGAAILMAALLLELGGAERAAGSIGVTCMLSAALLKLSFERAPGYKLRDQRLRVTELLDELKQMGVTPEGISENVPDAAAEQTVMAVANPISDTANSAVPTEFEGDPVIVPLRSFNSTSANASVPAGHAASQSRHAWSAAQALADETFDDPVRLPDQATVTRALAQLAAAESGWRALMGELQLPTVCTAGDAVAQLRRRIRNVTAPGLSAVESALATSDAPVSDGDADAAVRSLYRQYVKPWCEAADRCIHGDRPAAEESVDAVDLGGASSSTRIRAANLDRMARGKQERSRGHDELADPAVYQRELAECLRRLLVPDTGDSVSDMPADEEQPANAKRELARLQQELKSVKQHRAKVLERTGADNIASLQGLLEARHQRVGQQQRHRQLSAEIDAALQASLAGAMGGQATGALIRTWWQDHADLATWVQEARRQLAAQRQALIENQRQLQVAESEVARLAALRPRLTSDAAAIGNHVAATATLLDRAAWQWLGGILHAQVAGCANADCDYPGSGDKCVLLSIDGPEAVSVDAAELSGGAASTTATERPAFPTFLAAAERNLRRVTGRRELTLHWPSIDEPICVDLPVVDPEDESVAWQRLELTQLPAALCDDVVFAIQLALVRAFARKGEVLPLIWSDHNFRGGKRDAWVAKRLLRLAGEGLQVLLVTTQEPVTQMFHELSVPTLWIEPGSPEVLDSSVSWPEPAWTWHAPGADIAVEVPWDRAR